MKYLQVFPKVTKQLQSIDETPTIRGNVQWVPCPCTNLNRCEACFGSGQMLTIVRPRQKLV